MARRTANKTVRPPPQTRPVGRPRVDQRPRRRPPEEEILVAASRLFAKKGFAATSTREIAEAAGLRQGGIYHYYAQKIDILGAVAERIALPSIQRLEEVDATAIAPSVKLYRFLFSDLMGLSALPYDIAGLFWLKEMRADRFRRLWRLRRRLHATLERWIREGVSAGELTAVDAKLAASVALATQESTFSWYRPGGKRSHTSVAGMVTDQILCGLLVDRSRLESVRREASQS